DSIIKSLLQGKVDVGSITSSLFIDYVGKRNKQTARNLELVQFFSNYISIPTFILHAIVTQIKEDLGLTTTSHEDEVAKHAQTLHDIINRWMKATGRGPFNLSERATWQENQRRNK
ncbi:MAG: hypothetical protein U1C33_03940, partial [Candidatus Cloacimonadaceae bacterium]|nr:hypothetical protein [Candidatus Cloacimonadaceae bacterium]